MGLGQDLRRPGRALLGLPVEKLLGRLAGLVDHPGSLGLRFFCAGDALLLDGLELGLHLIGVLDAGCDLLLALVEGGENRLEREFPEDESDDREVDDLGEEKRPAQAEFTHDLRDPGGRLGGSRLGAWRGLGE